MKYIFFIFFLNFSLLASSQKIINVVWSDEKGITTEIEKAKYLIVVESYGDTSFERLDYNFAGPRQRKRTYKDADLKILNGEFADYNQNSYISSKGNYINNKKEGTWYVFDDTASAIFEYQYRHDSLLSVVNLDSVSKENKKIKLDTSGTVEAQYKGGQKKLTKFIADHFTIPQRTKDLQAGGTVKVIYMIDVDGKVKDTHLTKSVEFSFDEEVVRVVSSASDWTPASKNGKHVKAYRLQPFTLSFN
jgi:protein TonB